MSRCRVSKGEDGSDIDIEGTAVVCGVRIYSVYCVVVCTVRRDRP